MTKKANGDILLVCADRTGNIKWTKTYGGEGDDMGGDLLETPTGLILVSTVLNFQTIIFKEGNDLPYITFLSGYVASTSKYNYLINNFKIYSVVNL